MTTNRRELTPNLLPVYLVPYAIEFERAGESMWRATIDLRFYGAMTKRGIGGEYVCAFVFVAVQLSLFLAMGDLGSVAVRNYWIVSSVIGVALLSVRVWAPRKGGETLTITVKTTEITVSTRKGSAESAESIKIDQWTAGIRIIHLWRGGNKGRFHRMHAVYLRAPGHEIPLAVYEDAVDAKLYRERLPTPLGGHSHNYMDEGETRACMWDTWGNRVMTGQREGKVPGRRV